MLKNAHIIREGEPMAEITCTRCGATAEQMAKAPIRGRIGQEIHANVCEKCWDDWMRGEVMLINEYRLNLADPEHRKVLYEHMRQFFNLDTK
jgi:Fe-S cluster biosynthesis and repair protein YggX